MIRANRGGGLLRIAVISTQNRLLSGAIIKYMQERSELRPVHILEDNDEEPLKTCKSVQADVLLMEVNADPEDAKKVKELNKEGGIDTFFYSSVTGEYLVDMLDTL